MMRCASLDLRELNVGVLAAVTLCASSVAAQPVVFWVSQPIRPGETALLYGSDLDGTTAVSVARLPDGNPGPPGQKWTMPKARVTVPILQKSATSLKFVVPDSLKPGVFAAQVGTPSGETVVLLDRPQVLWAQGDCGLTASPGGWVRAFGTCLGWGAGRKTTFLLRGPKTVTVAAEADCYSAKAIVPKGLPTGEYGVFVHNGCGGPAGWSEPTKVLVERPAAWPETVFNVRQLGAKGDGQTDDTSAVAEALKQAAAKGGGVVYLPHGQYRLSAALEVPPYTVLRGESKELCHLYWTNRPTERLPAAIQGSHSFGLEDLTLWFVGANNGVVTDAKGAEAGNVFVRRVRMRWLLYGGYITIAEASQVLKETGLDGGAGAKGTLLKLTGKNLEVRDCDLYSSGNPISLTQADGSIIVNNDFHVGRLGYLCLWSGRRTIWENNRVFGADNMSRAGIFFPAAPYAEQMYFAHNRMERIWNADYEVFTSDGASPQYFGPIASATRAGVALPAPNTWSYGGPLDHTLFIVSGKGKGQYRRVVGSTDTMVTVDGPWDVVPDSTSVIGVNHTVRDWLVVGNEFTDANAVQVYGIGFNLLFAENTCTRIGGGFEAAMRGVSFWHAGRDARATEPEFFVQFLGNHIAEGARFDPRQYRTGTTGMELVCGSPNADWAYPFVIGGVFRGNRLDSDADLALNAGGAAKAPLIEDVIIEKNRLSKSDRGIVVSDKTQGILLRQNHFDQVLHPFSGPGVASAWLHPAEALAGRVESVRTALAQESNSLPPKWEDAALAVQRLMRCDKDDPKLRQECGEVLQDVRGKVARLKGGLHSPALMHALAGLSVSTQTAQPSLQAVLTSAKGGAAEMLVTATLAHDEAELTLEATPSWPEGWQSTTSSATASITPGSSTTLKLPVTVPAGAWGLHAIPVALRASVRGLEFAAEATSVVGTGDLREWMVLGPLPGTQDGSPDNAVRPPEDRLDLNAEYQGTSGRIRWQPATLTGQPFHLDKFLKATQGVAYALTCVRAAEETMATLTVTTRSGLKVWLNEEELSASRQDAGEPTRRRATVHLRAGDNFLLVKLANPNGPWELEAHLTPLDPKGRVRLQVVPAAQLCTLKALTPLPLPPASIELSHNAGVAWRLVLEEKFTGVSLGPQWRKASGEWKAKDGVLVGEGTAAFFSYTHKVAAPVRIEYDARSSDPHDLSAFWLDAPPDWTRGYLFGFASGNNTEDKILVDGDQIATVDKPLAVPRKWHHVIAQVLANGRCQLIVDGHKAIDLVRPCPRVAKYPGLWVWGPGGEFDNVRLYTATE